MALHGAGNVALLPVSRPMRHAVLRHRCEMTAMPSVLAEKTCTPCRGGEPPLTPDAAETYHRQAPDWSLLDQATRIERTYRFKNFGEAFAFVERAAALAEAEFHHPDISFGWGFAIVSLRTKKIKGLHENDFIMAAKLDRIAAALSSP
jgi:4a-hydroxytetrahydrobiopterin dehydratase